MKCASCSAEIADKAIVCYRCGTPTAVPPVPGKAPVRRDRSRLIVLLGILVVLVGLLLFTYLSRS